MAALLHDVPYELHFNYLAVIAAICFVFFLLWKGRYPDYSSRSTKGLNTRLKLNGSTTVSEVLFFPDKEFNKRKMNRPNNPRDLKSSIEMMMATRSSPVVKMANYLRQAKRKLDICMFKFTAKSLLEVILDLHKTGVKVRIITDAYEDEDPYSQMDDIRKAGIKIKSNHRQTENRLLMHHKFTIVDDKLLLMGSLNWTYSAMTKNHEAIIVTSETTLIEPFVVLFEELWDKFEWHTERTKQEREESRIKSIKAYNSNVLHSIPLAT